MFNELVSPIEYAEWLGYEVYGRFVDDMITTGILTTDEDDIGDEDEGSDFYDTKEEFDKD